MRQLVYVSTASAVGKEDLDAILHTATARNARLGVTGLLLFNGQNFLQVLEGGGDSVGELMHGIIRDQRHSGLVVLNDIGIEERCFPDWSMRLLRLSTSLEERRLVLNDNLPPHMDLTVRNQVLSYAALN